MLDPEVAIDAFNGVYGKHAARALHAKGRFYEGTFTPTESAGLLCRAGHFQAESVPVLVRFSNAGGNPRRSDEAGDVRGMAVSFKLADGTATDLLGQTAPRFPVRTPEEFIELTKLARHQFKLPLFLAKHRHAIPALLENARAGALKPVHSYAEPTYYTIHAYKWIAPDGKESWVRHTLVPQAIEKHRLAEKFTGKDRLQEELAARLARGPVKFNLEVQIAHDLDDPHDPMSVWGKESRHVDAGEIVITAPVPDPEQDGNVVVFDPTRIVDGIELSDDPILRYRPTAYSTSVGRRLSK